MGTTLHSALTKIPMTRQQFGALGDNKHREYYDGMCVANPPRKNHVRAARRLGRLLQRLTGSGVTVGPVSVSVDPRLLDR
jgi:hypothetical protein